MSGEGTHDTAGDDAAVEAAVLRELLVLHPSQMTLAELLRDLTVDPASFAERDAVERAVHELARAGLLHRNGEFVVPSRAAVRFEQLLGG